MHRKLPTIVDWSFDDAKEPHPQELRRFATRTATLERRRSTVKLIGRERANHPTRTAPHCGQRLKTIDTNAVYEKTNA